MKFALIIFLTLAVPITGSIGLFYLIEQYGHEILFKILFLILVALQFLLVFRVILLRLK